MALANRKIGYDEVVTRDIHFPMNVNNVARHWLNNDPWTTHWMNAILAAVPDGERWVMNSARRQLDKLDDPEVRKAAIEFIRQERIHAREHDEMNAIGVQHGVPIDKVEGVFKLIRKQLQHRLSDDMQSSIAAAFEHFTAIISSVLLEHPELFDDTHPELRAMLYWHFVEETEHKSVSFDVFVDASGGGLRSYRLRTSGMLLAIALGFPIMIGNQTYLLYKDRQVLNLRSAAHMLKVLFWRPGILSKVLGGVLPYFSPTFHPWDDDNREVIRIWKRAYEKTGDTQQAYQALRDHRAGKARGATPAPTAEAAWGQA
ncbi:metal-dependent hydrolase [Isoalcanivorax pacificus W11-5]|jgi:predicted metal-dependent hydrolase|uniref:Metal-dependent hydrolase n=1 Tax=Isoalcanivorax pacificus W11-5 TaxID=391936 RepID=A0A0B4XNJ1_9GAMM|nr:metal-dependent hydrolase [Isoalcanivorax pacificus]AJD48656.1 metal-dependent hydrolase [Isoalcanivorax pacificus W11-5]